VPPSSHHNHHFNGLKQRIADVFQREREKLGMVIGGELAAPVRPVKIDVPQQHQSLVFDVDAGTANWVSASIECVSLNCHTDAETARRLAQVSDHGNDSYLTPAEADKALKELVEGYVESKVLTCAKLMSAIGW
jgi:hypothetical protein